MKKRSPVPIFSKNYRVFLQVVYLTASRRSLQIPKERFQLKLTGH